MSLMAAAIIGLTLAFSSRAAESPSALTANDLAFRLSVLRQDDGSYVRLRMEIKGRPTKRSSFKSRNAGRRLPAEVVYQVLYPKERKGESVLLRKTGTLPPVVPFSCRRIPCARLAT
jgi:hypothetical protein